jgi:hypothetical protein
VRTVVLRVALAATVCLTAAACTMATEPAGPVRTADAEGTFAPIHATPLPTPDVNAIANDAVFGKWRRAPAYPTPKVRATAEAACREQDEVGDLPLKVLDARGEGEVTLVFADARTAVVCFATAKDETSATATARPVAGYPETKALDPEKLGIHDEEIVDAGARSRFIVVGRVGDKVHDVGASFDDWTWGKASMADGWYAIWWPGSQPALTIAASDSRSIAIDSYTP